MPAPDGGGYNGTNEPAPPTARLTYGERWVRKKIDLLELVTLRGAGLSLREIAARAGVGKTTVMRRLRRYGVAL